MDGAFLSYHNTEKTFGFEYIQRETIEKLLFGSTFHSEISFFVGSKILTTILNEIKDFFKDEKFDFLKIGYYSKPSNNSMTIFVEVFEGEDYLELKNTEIKKTKRRKEIN